MSPNGIYYCKPLFLFYFFFRLPTTEYRMKRVNPADIKDMLLRWSRAKTRGYEVRLDVR